MTEVLGAQLDEAHEALRAWCHERPDLRDPSIVYRTFGSVTAIMSTLEHVLELAARSAGLATRTDDSRSVRDACDEIRDHTGTAVEALENAYRAVATAHTVCGHLVFAAADDHTA
jgi:hypothetical protein